MASVCPRKPAAPTPTKTPTARQTTPSATAARTQRINQLRRLLLQRKVFYAPRGASGKGSLFVEGGDYEFFEFSCSFAEWLYRWLMGEEMTGPGGSAFYPGPVVLEDLPMNPDERPEKRYGPPRGM
ncbi:hypothetical protein [Streptomyces sp. NPDC091217]|uniref:hypothetical protein n=1 Tax=Streptomyces sp. NPDC091217 TaxID=3365975 RepID=UPI0037F139F0